MSIVVPIIVGPTAIGKTHLSMLLAEKIPSEIISADSRQIYRHMDIGTAKVDLKTREKVVHHMIDINNPDEYFSAGMFSKIASNIIAEVMSAGKLPIIVGGSGFYISALIDGIFDMQIHNPDIREQLKKKAQNDGLDILYRELQKCDPDYAAKIGISDTQRILRSLEVFMITGQSFSDWHKQNKNPADFPYKIIGLNMDRKALYKRIEERVDKMLDEGLIDEVKNLQALGYDANLTALKTVGYKEVFAYLNDEITLDIMIGLIKQNTRRYAKRQLTWFRRDKRITWMNVSKNEDFKHMTQELIKIINTYSII